MKKLLLSLLCLLALALPVHAQVGNTTIIRFTGAPTGNCAPLSLGINNATGALYDCVAGVWTLVGSPGGGALPGGTGTQLQYRAGASTFGGVAGSSVAAHGEIGLAFTAGWAGTGLTLTQPNDDNSPFFITNTSAPAGNGAGINVDNLGNAYVSGSPDGVKFPTIQFDTAGNIDVTGLTASFNVTGIVHGSGSGTFGTDNSAAGTVTLSNSAANAHTVWGSGATTTNTINGFATVPTTGHLIDCTVSSTTCLLHDSGIATAGVTQTIASGAKALATGAISSGTCTSAQTDTATGTLSTDTIQVTSNADITGVTGYAPVTSGMLTIFPYPTANTVNFKVCNLTASSITPGAVTLNWRVTR